MKNINDLNPGFSISKDIEMLVYRQHSSYKLPGGDEDVPATGTDDDDMDTDSDEDAIKLADDDSGDDEDIDYDGTPLPTEEELEEEIFTTDENDEI